jgi:hypothetical protein
MSEQNLITLIFKIISSRLFYITLIQEEYDKFVKEFNDESKLVFLLKGTKKSVRVERREIIEWTVR